MHVEPGENFSRRLFMSGAAARQDVAAGMNVLEAEVTENQLLS